MRREVFEQELAEPQALLDELAERVSASTIEKLKAKILSGASRNVGGLNGTPCSHTRSTTLAS